MATWHPSHSAIEVTAGEWWMPDPLDKPYAVVRLVEVRGERGYRVVTYAPESDDRKLIGYFGNLRAATMGANRWYVANCGYTGIPYAGWLPVPDGEKSPYGR
jgi:hypothetical protein